MWAQYWVRLCLSIVQYWVMESHSRSLSDSTSNLEDVMLQQDPFAKDTEENLSGILEQAQKLIAEAKSIEEQKV